MPFGEETLNPSFSSPSNAEMVELDKEALVRYHIEGFAEVHYAEINLTSSIKNLGQVVDKSS